MKTPRTRRTFLKLMAVSAAALAVPATPRRSGAAGTSRKSGATKTGAAKSGSAAPSSLQKELDKQKHSTAEALKVIRDYPLPAGGGEMAFAFAPMKARPQRKSEASASREDAR